MDDIINKIMQLKVHSESVGATKAEAESFAAKAAELMKKHALEDIDLHARPDHEHDKRKIKYMGPWRRELIKACAHACFCKVVFGRGETINLVGRPLNVRACYEMFHFIEQQCVIIARQICPGDRKAQRRAEGGLGEGVAEKIKASCLMDADRLLPVVQERDAADEAAHGFMKIKMRSTRGSQITQEHMHGQMHAGRIQIREEMGS